VKITLVYTPRNIPGEIIDEPIEFQWGYLYPIKALEGKPFVGGAKQSVRTAYTYATPNELRQIVTIK
jgi:hypothetical protein